MWENLKSTVNNVIRPNDNREITGEKHNNTLSAVINSLGKYSQFAGLAFKNTNPGVPDGPVFYFAAFKGVYLNFNRIEVEENEVAILNYNNNKWEKIVIGYSPIAPATIEDIRLTTLIDAVNSNNALKTNFEFKQDSILGVQLPFLHAAISHIDADGQLIKGKPTSEVLIPVPLAEASTDADTPGKHGFMSYQDKDLLDSIPNYTISGKKISENPILTYDDIQGVAYLGEDGKIPSSLLPSYVDDVLEYDSIDNFPLIGEGGKIYLDKKANLAYRWSGTTYVSISSSIALGETSSTAYAGDKGKKNAEDIANLKANKADKTSVYTKEEVDYLIEHFKLPDHIKAITFSVDGILVSKNEDGNLVIGGNVIVEGGISMYGPGQFGDTIMDYIVVDGTSIKIIDGKLTVDPDFVGGGTVKGIKVNGYTYDEVDTNGYITIPDYPTELAWNSITGKPSTFMPSAHTHKIEDITDIANASVSHATTADRLKKEIKIWGQPFDGSTDVEGAISNVDVINMANADTVISLYIKNGVLFIEGDLAVTGGITMYASDGVKSGMIDQVYAVLDKSIFSIKDGVITIKGDIGGGTVKAVKVGGTQYDPDSDGIISLPEYPTVSTLEWDNILNKPSLFPPSAHTHAISEIISLQATLDGKAAASHTHAYLPLSGGTMTGALNFKNGTWNLVGDDAYMGDCNVAGMIGIKGANATTPGFALYNNSGTQLGKLYANGGELNWSGGTIKATTFSGNASTASLLALNTSPASTVGTAVGSWSPISNKVYVYRQRWANTAAGSDTADLSIYLDGNLTANMCLDGYYFSLLGFKKDGSSDSYVLLGGGGHKAESSLSVNYASSSGYASSAGNADTLDGYHYSSFAWASHSHSYLPLSGGTVTGITSFNINNQWLTPSILQIGRTDATKDTSKAVIGVTDGNMHIDAYHNKILYLNFYNKGQIRLGYQTGNYYISEDGSYYNGNANTATLPYGFTSRDSDWMGSWGMPGTYITAWGNSGGSIGFKVDGSHINVATDGYFYHGIDIYGGALYRCLDTHDSGGYGLITTGNYSSYALPITGGKLLGSLEINSTGGSFNEGIRMHVAANNWCGLVMCGSDNTGSTGTSPNTWGIHNNNGYLYINRDGSNGPTAYIFCNINGNWGMGTNSPSVKLHVVGDILASGGITMYSDLRKKNILSDEVLSVKEIAAAPLFAHTYKSDENHYLHIGTSAQYWSAIHEGWFTRKDSEGYYQMELQNLGVAMGISLAREIVKYESKTDKKIRLMKKKINDLEARIKELEGSREERRTA